MTVELKIIRKVVSFHKGIGGIGTEDWEIELECGHTLKRLTSHLQQQAFQDEYVCLDCEKRFKDEIEMFQLTKEYPAMARLT